MSPAPSISARDRRAILVGALIVLPALFFVWGVRPFLSSLDDARDLLAGRERAELGAAVGQVDDQQDVLVGSHEASWQPSGKNRLPDTTATRL